MLYLDAPIGPIGGLMIYRDHADPDLFYYVPERPRLANNDGVPEFVFLKYRRDITDNPDFDPDVKQALGGGFLAFTVDLGVSDEQLDDMKRELGRFSNGEVKLTPIQFRKGSVRLTITKDAADAPGAEPAAPRGLTFFEEVYGATQPSLFGFNRATFAVVLSQEAATLFEAALKSGISPVGVIYDLEFLGLRPAFHVKITAEYKRIYESLEVGFGARGQIGPVSVAAEVDVAFQKLRDSGAVKVEVLNFTDDESLRKQADDAFNWFKTDLIKDFFKTSMEPPSFMRANSGGGLLGQLQNLLGPMGASQTGSPLPQMGAPTTQAPTPASPPTNQASGMATGQSQTGAAVQGGGAGGTQSNLSPFQVGFSLKVMHQDELKTREFEYSMQAAVARTAAPQGLFSTVVEGLDLDKAIKEVNLDDDFFKRLVATVSMGGDLVKPGINVVAVNLEYPANRKPNEEPEHVDGFLFKPDALDPHTFTAWLNKKKALDYRYQLDIHFKPDSPWVGKEAHVTTPWRVTRDRQLTVDPLDDIGLFDIELALGTVDAAQIDQIQVEMTYEDAANDFETQKTFVLRPGSQASARWQLRLSDPRLRTYRYRLTYFLKDGVRYQTDWQTSEDPSLVINDPFEGSLKLRLVPLLDPAALLEANVNLQYEEAATGYERRVQALFAGGAPLTSQAITIPTLAKDPSDFSYDVTVIRQDGSVFESGTITSAADTKAIVISDGAGTTRRIKVKLVNPDLASANLAAVRVNVVGPGENPDTAEALFTAGQVIDQTLTLVQPDEGGTFTYSYSVTGYTRQGLPLAGQTGGSSSLNLLIPLPQP
ncbi:MAG TPA: hypothetical protein VLT87_25790 [Thermoanaerobaculia bacterium]|nr:hypothetical protein [Thermoanaerobaculia bacterium]